MSGGQEFDETVAVNAIGDETVVANLPRHGAVERSPEKAQAEQAGDETFVSEGTIVVVSQAGEQAPARSASLSASIEAEAAATHGSLTSSSSVGSSSFSITGTGLDPRRPIAPVPGTTPWDVAPTGERGLAQGLPVSYGARTHRAPGLQTGTDEVRRRLGPPPSETPVAVRQGREALPSLERRDRRSRAFTLALYGAVVLVSVIGLWALASIAFGW